jgi:hypothetical protein
VLTFERRGSGVRFVVVPMIHLGLPEFFDAVRQRLMACEVVVAEGVPGLRARIITLAYRMAGRLRRDDLIDQGNALDLSTLDAEVVRPDLDAKQFGTGWRGVSRWLRGVIYLGAPLVGVWMAIAGPRRVLSHRLTIDDEISLEEFEAGQGGLHEAFIEQRDRALCEELVRLADIDAGATRTIGVCWGAAHVRAVADTLHDLGFRITDAAWITVF